MIVDRHPRRESVGAFIARDRYPTAGVSVANSLNYTLLHPTTDTSAKKRKTLFLCLFSLSSSLKDRVFLLSRTYDNPFFIGFSARRQACHIHSAQVP